MVVSAPSTFHLGDVKHVRAQLEHAAMAFEASSLLFKLRCSIDILKIARMHGLGREEVVKCTDELIHLCTVKGGAGFDGGSDSGIEKLVSPRSTKTLHAAVLLVTESYVASERAVRTPAGATTQHIRMQRFALGCRHLVWSLSDKSSRGG